MGSSRQFTHAGQDYVTLGNDIWKPYTAGSISLWIYCDTIDSKYHEISFNYQTSPAVRVGLLRIAGTGGQIPPAANNKFTVQFLDSVIGNHWATGMTTAISAGSWHHLVVTAGGRGTEYKMWVNNISQTMAGYAAGWTVDASKNDGTWFGDLSDVVIPCQIGRNATSSIDGKVADFRFCNKVLSATEVALLYNRYPYVAMGNLINRYRMTDSGATVKDWMNNNNGTNNGTTESFVGPSFYEPSPWRVGANPSSVVPPTPVPADSFAVDLYSTRNRSKDMNLTKTRGRDLYSTRDREVTLVR